MISLTFLFFFCKGKAEKNVKRQVENNVQGRKPVSNPVSDEHIQTIIDRIKSKTGEDLTTIKDEKKRTGVDQGFGRKRLKKTRNSVKEGTEKDTSLTDVVVIDDKEEPNQPTAPNQTYQCYRCRTIFSSSQNLEFHEKTCTCKPIEDISFDEQQGDSEAQSSEHVKSCESTDVLDHICDQCGKMFSQETELSDHISNHENTKSLTCKVCKKVCKSKMLLKIHMEMHASHKLNYVCVKCGKSFFTKNKFELHAKMHVVNMAKQERGKVFECDVCKTTFEQKTDLIHHIAEEHTTEQTKDDEKDSQQLKSGTLSSVNCLTWENMDLGERFTIVIYCDNKKIHFRF